MPYFVENIEEIRAQARRKIDDGAVTAGYRLDTGRVIAILNDALATEIVCVLRYMHHYFMATGVHGRAVAEEFKEHADEEREHADKIGERIQQLGGKPDLNPGTLVDRSVSQYVEGETLADMIREDLVAERIVIDVYRDMIRFFGNDDPTSRMMMEGIMAEEEEHAADLADFLYIVDPSSGETEGIDRGAVDAVATGREFQTDAPDAQKRPTGNSRRGGEAESRSQARSDTQAAGRQEQSGKVARIESRRSSTDENEMQEQPAEHQSGRQDSDVRRMAQKREGIRGESRPARASGEERPESSTARGQTVPPAHAPGSTGRPTRKRTPMIDAIEAAQEEQAQAGESRAVRITNPSRKGKKIA